MSTLVLDTDAKKSTPKARRGGSAIFVAAGILFSRMSGLVRQAIFAHFLGNSEAAGAFRAALRIPNILQNLFGEGVLSASFIPVYSKLIAEGDEDLAGRVAGAVASLLAAGISVMVLVGVVLTPWFVDLIAPGFHGEVRELTVRIVQILYPGVGLLVLSAWCLGILNSHRKFFLSYVAPVFWNLAMIVTMVALGSRLMQGSLAIALAWGSVVGSFLQLGVQLPFVFRYAPKIHFAFNTTLEPVREIFRNVTPVLVSRGVVQVSAYIDGIIASFLGASAVASLAYAQTLFLLPISLFGMSIAAAELPEMSSSVGEQSEVYAQLRKRLVSGKRNICFFVIPTVVAFIFLGREMVAALYQTGKFGTQDTLYVWYILMGSTIGLLAVTWGRLYSSAFYALRDTRTPLVFAIVRVILTVILGLLFAFPLRPLVIRFLADVLRLHIPALPGIHLGLGAVGLTATAGAAGWVEFLLLRSALCRRIGKTVVPGIYQFRVWVAALSAAGVALAFSRFLLPSVNVWVPLRIFHYDLRPLVIIGTFGCSFFLIAFLLQIEEAGRVIRRILRF